MGGVTFKYLLPLIINIYTYLAQQDSLKITITLPTVVDLEEQTDRRRNMFMLMPIFAATCKSYNELHSILHTCVEFILGLGKV